MGRIEALIGFIEDSIGRPNGFLAQKDILSSIGVNGAGGVGFKN